MIQGEKMSATSKGKTFENFCADQLKQAGWTILFKSIRVRYGAIDFAGMWDIVAVKKQVGGIQWFFIQCKSRKLYGKEKQALIDWKNTYGFSGINCAVGVKIKERIGTVGAPRVGVSWEYL